MNFDSFATNNIEHKVGFDNKNTIAGTFKLVISWYVSEKRVSLKIANALIEFINKCRCISRAVICDPVEDRGKIINSYRKITENMLICHANVA